MADIKHTHQGTNPDLVALFGVYCSTGQSKKEEQPMAFGNQFVSDHYVSSS